MDKRQQSARPPIYDGSGRFLGVVGGQHPLDIGKLGGAANAINREFRSGVLSRTRPRTCELRLRFENDEDEDWFRNGSVQGGISYLKTSRYRSAGIVLAVSGKIFFGRMAGQTIAIKRIFDGMSADVMNIWFVQAEERVYWQDGINLPGAWSGDERDAAYSIEKIADRVVMPIGNLMAYAHGRVLVCNEFNQVAVSDHFNGGGYGLRNNCEFFDESITFYGGTFSPPTQLGKITGIKVLPAQESRNYHGAVVLLCESGAATLDISGPRFTVDNAGEPTGFAAWQDAKALYVGTGFVSSVGAVTVNNDLWARRFDGIQTLQTAYQRESSGWTRPTLSRGVSHYLAYDSPMLLEFCPMGYHDNRVFCGVMPTTRPGKYGTHRYCQGAVVADVLGSVDSEGTLQWDGLWTGPNPILYLSVVTPALRMLIVSCEDGVNHIHEQTRSYGPDLFMDGSSPIEGLLDSSAYEFGSRFIPKEFVGGGRTNLKFRGMANYDSLYRADDGDCWHELTLPKVFGSLSQATGPLDIPDKPGAITFAQSTPNSVECGPEQRPANRGHWFQIRHRFTGDVQLVMSRVKAFGDPDNETEDCGISKRDFTLDEACCGEQEFLVYQFGR
jgi:hypothetical protein